MGPRHVLLVLLGHSEQAFFLRLTAEEQVDMRPLFNHAEQEKLLDHLNAYMFIHLYASSQLALRPELVRLPGRYTFLIGFLLDSSHCFTVPG